MRRRRIAIALAAAGALGAAALVAVEAPWDGNASAGEGETAPAATATAERRDLVASEDVTGALGYADARSLVSTSGGTVTGLPAQGSTARRGDVLYRIDTHPTVLFYGTLPAYRALSRGDDGRDVRQLEQNLVALGYDPDGEIDVDGDFDWATEVAVERWQQDHHLEESGVVALGDVVFLPGARRIGKVTAQVGGRAGGEILQTTARAREVALDLAATDQDLVRAGQRVRVELPDESTVTGTVKQVGSVATTSAEGETTLPVTVSVPGKGLTSLDAAPVTVSIETERARDALSVPTTALLALAGGGYGVEVVGSGGARTLVGVKTGSFADGYVQVEGEGVQEGTVVVVAE